MARARTRQVGADNVYALSLDLVQSRRVQDRKGFGAHLEKTLSEMGRRFAASWMAPPVTARGIDEVSAAMSTPTAVFDFLVALNLAVWPQRFRMGLGIGIVDVGLEGDAADLDGPGFHHAAEAVRRAAREGIPFAIEGGARGRDQTGVVEAAALLHGRVMGGWHPAMHAAVVAYRDLQTQAKAARRLRLTQQAVSQALDRAQHDDLTRTEDAVRLWLAGLGGVGSFAEVPRGSV